VYASIRPPVGQQIVAMPFPLIMEIATKFMDNDTNQDREHDVKDRIADFMQAEAQAQGKPATKEELQTLQLAVGRLDQLLADAAADDQAQRKRATEEEVQTLRAAVARLDQFLAEINTKRAVSESKD
jgi:uncharacterized protein YlxW (UPF0749 family)